MDILKTSTVRNNYKMDFQNVCHNIITLVAWRKPDDISYKKFQPSMVERSDGGMDGLLRGTIDGISGDWLVSCKSIVSNSKKDILKGAKKN